MTLMAKEVKKGDKVSCLSNSPFVEKVERIEGWGEKVRILLENKWQMILPPEYIVYVER